MQRIVTAHLDAVRTDINNGYKPGVTLTQTLWYHRCVHEQADRFLASSVTYFGDMVSFFDEIATPGTSENSGNSGMAGKLS